MARIILEDVKFNKERREIISKKEIDNSPLPIPEIKKQIKKQNRNPRMSHKFIKIIFIIILFVGVIYLAGNIFEKANIEIISKHQIINYEDKQFIASKDLNNNVNFEIMITSDKKLANVILTEPKEVSIKAEGSITLYNEFSTKSEKISAGTFVTDNEGRTYKINSTVSIPGYKTVDKKIVPGEISVKITSFLPGDVYNGEPTDFHINTFKGTSKYNKIYGKLKTPLVGGASGLVYIVDEASQKIINNIANTSFKEDLLQQVRSLVPPGYILYPGAYTFSYKINNNTFSKSPNAEIEIEGTISVVLLEEKSLINNIIKVSLPTIENEELKEIEILGIDNLSFSFINKEQQINKDINSISFSLTGDIDAVWNPDQELLKTKLLGVHKDDVLPIFRQDPGISSAIVNIFPPWKKYIPNELLKININIK